ncbi:uncharacterized protein [Spinacia oleracea]|uniref:RING-type domain-containing protein n=1 Tax=Spinacia oleracea TaxID=3562 RepID=A0ABM3QTK7_SPIOL|nr:uncharacterized protein LOC110795641 [Spinacia oleracea]
MFHLIHLKINANIASSERPPLPFLSSIDHLLTISPTTTATNDIIRRRHQRTTLSTTSDDVSMVITLKLIGSQRRRVSSKRDHYTRRRFTVASILLTQLGISVGDDGHLYGHDYFHGHELIIQVSLLLGIILIIVLIFLIRRFFKKRQQHSTPPSIQLPNVPPSQVPETSTNLSNTLPETYVLRRLPEEIYRSFQVDTYSTERCNDFSHIDCMICNFAFVDGEDLCILPVCRHVDGEDLCILPVCRHSSWFLSHDCRCTVCRHDYFDGFNNDQLVM